VNGVAAQPASPPAELVFFNGSVYTVDAARTWASAVAVAGGRIVFVGEDAGARGFVGPETRVIDLRGRMLLPGFQDSHIHPRGGIYLTKVRLHSVLDPEEVFRRIKAYADAHPEQAWIEGAGWEVAAFKPAGVPTRAMLDALVPDRPAFLTASDGHTGWANSKALALAGITRDTPDPPNGIIGRDPETRAPNGVLYEAAMVLVRRHIPPPTADERLEGIRGALRELNAHGVTALVDAGASPETDAAFAELARAGALTARTVLCQSFDPARGDDEQAQEFLERRRRLPAGSPRATCVKLMLDGIIEQYTGALLEPYLDRPAEQGPLFLERERLQRLVTRLDAEGFQIHIHAIGDRAVREALDALAAAQGANGPRSRRHCLAHVELIHPADIPRLRQLGVAANMTPLWARGDDINLVFTEPRLGPERSRWLYPHKTILDTGGRLVWGTDWPVTSLAPLEGIETAVSRQLLGGRDAAGNPDRAWIPEERLALEQAIAAYTIAGAWLAFEDRERGSIELSKRADLVVLEKNLFEVPPQEIHRVRVEMTVLDGRIVYERTGPTE
jgi:hypothetical protein